jgi:CspA family cold shock protein
MASARGVVRVWHAAEGWGVIDSVATPGGCWAHFSALAVAGYREAPAGQAVDFEFEETRQDGFDYRAVRVDIEGRQPMVEQDRGQQGAAEAYRSRLTLKDDPPEAGQ